ncbi:MerR family transcriptional regulator [Nocardioides panacisoli]|uniref:MerR family transcriptional regulator n=1 Tax=Nocardioides panacisoli TaxID=627624 RepID=UPI001C638E1D|nr:MerR family transcriptional regulator [Nocardioides panacisoli]QYJ02608.1 MerR family transcriptional regulator [Nocardioides panacisoli]
MRIGEVARQLEIDAHVLRHWEDVGVVRPARSPQGYREYDEESLARLRVVRQCQEAGMSLAQIRGVLDRTEDGREAVIRAHQQVVRSQLLLLERTSTFLDHVLTCRHSLMSRCPDCAAYSDGDRP